MSTKITWIPARTTGAWEMVKVNERSGIGTRTGFTVSLAETVNWPDGYGGKDHGASQGSNSRVKYVPSHLANPKAPGEVRDLMLRLRSKAQAPYHQPPEVSDRINAAYEAEAVRRESADVRMAATTVDRGYWAERETYLRARWGVKAAIYLVSKLSVKELERARREADPGTRAPKFRTTKAARAHFMHQLDRAQLRLDEAQRLFENREIRREYAHEILNDPKQPAFLRLRKFIDANPSYFSRIRDAEFQNQVGLLLRAEAQS